MTEMRNCARCGAAFEPRREHARFCSAGCRIAWNEEVAGEHWAESALAWSVTAMLEVVGRAISVTEPDLARAAGIISEAVWWTTIVDATLLRYRPDAYDDALGRQAPAQCRATEGILAGLRYVRNRMGRHLDLADLLGPDGAPGGRAAAGPVRWMWQPDPPPALPGMPPRGRAWEMARYRAYQAHLAGHSVADTFRCATDFLSVTASDHAAAT